MKKYPRRSNLHLANLHSYFLNYVDLYNSKIIFSHAIKLCLIKQIPPSQQTASRGLSILFIDVVGNLYNKTLLLYITYYYIMFDEISTPSQQPESNELSLLFINAVGNLYNKKLLYHL